mmetsp:Transcript_6227/g.14193  ORF Transcript_6227/g.14193 Transcript_6227/m.14193 type:complete len:214 (-) Transcript_6227:1217-1858(-)
MGVTACHRPWRRRALVMWAELRLEARRRCAGPGDRRLETAVRVCLVRVAEVALEERGRRERGGAAPGGGARPGSRALGVVVGVEVSVESRRRRCLGAAPLVDRRCGGGEGQHVRLGRARTACSWGRQGCEGRRPERSASLRKYCWALANAGCHRAVEARNRGASQAVAPAAPAPWGRRRAPVSVGAVEMWLRCQAREEQRGIVRYLVTRRVSS